MELRDGDLVLRPWTEDDVDAMVAGCNDPDVAWWIPTIPSSVHGGGCAGVHTRRGRAGRAELSRSTIAGAVVGGIGLGRRRSGSPRRRSDTGSRRIARGRGTCTRAVRLLCTLRARRARASTARPRHRSRQRRVAACRREGRVPARGRPSRSPATPGRADPRLGDVLAATRRASRVTNRGRGRSSRLRARGDAARDRRAVGVS